MSRQDSSWRWVSRLPFMLVVCLALVSCGSRTEETSTTPTEEAAPQQAMMSDANVAAVVVSYNNVEIEHARLAQEKASNAQVKEFAVRMVTDHQAVNQNATDLATKLGLTPEDNDASRSLVSDGTTKRESMRALSGAEFDRAYIENEIALHQAALDLIDTNLMPSAQNAELKALLEQTRPAVVAHLDHAKQIQGTLGPS